ncbi:MAG: ATP-binding cassette domain-containing protein [Anaerolineae bacterium]
MTGKTAPIVEARGLDVRYTDRHALKRVDLSILPGSFVLIGGPSGSGKSTLAQALLGLLHQQEASFPVEVHGEIGIAGLTPGRHGVAQLASQVGLVFQNPATQLFNATVQDEVAFGPRNLGLPPGDIDRRVGEALEATGCKHLRGRSVRHLSGGEQQRVAIAANLAMRPSLLILDEPTANLDQQGTRSVADALMELRRCRGVTVVLIEHRLEPFVPLADRLIWLEDGRVVADGRPQAVLEGTRVELSRPSPPSRSWRTPLVSLEGVIAGYDRRPVLQDCSFTLREGEFAALVGPNGAGKSTLARVLAGLLRPRRGRVIWHATNGKRPRVGFLQQNPLHQLVCQTVEEEVRYGPRNLGTERDEDVEALLARADLLSLRRRATQALSVGEQQRSALAATLSLCPGLLILDEPTIGQDWHHLSELMDLVGELNRQGQTVLLITHDRRLVGQYAGRVWGMVGGRVESTEEALERAH